MGHYPYQLNPTLDRGLPIDSLDGVYVYYNGGYFDKKISNGALNTARGLFQYQNGTQVKPQKGDLIVFASYILNPYGHVAIISKVTDKDVEIIQQNAGPGGESRVLIELQRTGENWHIKNNRVLGWLRKEKK